MFEKNKLLRAMLVASLSTGLAACGGSSNSGSDPASPPPGGDQPPATVSAGSEEGRFVDSAVAGIEYETSTGYQSLTGDNGEFNYNDGETVTFKLGALTFGSVSAKGLVTPVDLAANDPAKTANIARVLQTLDDDGIPGNGITITPEAREKAAKQNPTDVATVDLVASKDIILSLASENTVPPKDLVTEAEAESHLDETLAAVNPVTGCGTDTTPVTEAHLAGKTYGFIRSQLDDKEINLMNFGVGGTVTEFHNDMGVSSKQVSSKWAITTGGEVSFTDTAGTETFNACAVAATDGTPYYLIFEDSATQEIIKLYSTNRFAQPTVTESYMLASIITLTDGTPVEVKRDLLTIDSELSAEFLSDVGMTTATIVDGTLEVPDQRGQAAASTDELHLLAAQGQRIGIYLDFDSSGALLDVQTATSIPQAIPVTNASFEGKAFVDNVFDEDESKEETIINVFSADGKMYDYHNDAYDSSTGEQIASVDTSNWSVNDNTGELTETETYEVRDADGNVTGTEQYSETFRVFESARNVYSREDKNDGSFEVIRISKTQPIAEAAFIGTYNVRIPTENTVDNELVISTGGVCTYSGVACTWSINTAGKATLDFGAAETATAQIWQFANNAEKYAFLITHSDDAADIEVGLMTGK